MKINEAVLPKLLGNMLKSFDSQIPVGQRQVCKKDILRRPACAMAASKCFIIPHGIANRDASHRHKINLAS